MIDRIRRYLEIRQTKAPMPQLGDFIHVVNASSEWEGTLLLSDLRELVAKTDELERAALEAVAGTNLLRGTECVTISRKAYDLLCAAVPNARARPE